MFAVILQILSLLKSVFRIGDIVTDLYQTSLYNNYSTDGSLYDQCAQKNGSNSTETLNAAYAYCAEVIWFLPPTFAVICALCLGGSRPKDPGRYYLSNWVFRSFDDKEFPPPPKCDNTYADFAVELTIEFLTVGLYLYIVYPLIELLRVLTKLLKECMNVSKILGTATEKELKKAQKDIDEAKEMMKKQKKLENYLILMQALGECLPQMLLTWTFANNEKEFLLQCGESDVLTINDMPVPLTFIFSVVTLIISFCELFAVSCTYLWNKCMEEEM